LSWLSIRCGELRGKDCSQERWDGKRKKRFDSSGILLISVNKVMKMKQLKDGKKKEFVLLVNALQLPSNVGKAGGVEWPYDSSGTRHKG